MIRHHVIITALIHRRRVVVGNRFRPYSHSLHITFGTASTAAGSTCRRAQANKPQKEHQHSTGPPTGGQERFARLPGYHIRLQHQNKVLRSPTGEYTLVDLFFVICVKQYFGLLANLLFTCALGLWCFEGPRMARSGQFCARNVAREYGGCPAPTAAQRREILSVRRCRANYRGLWQA